MPRKTDGARDPLGYPRGIGQIFLGACADDCLGLQGAEALRHRWNWNKWGRNKSLDNDSDPHVRFLENFKSENMARKSKEQLQREAQYKRQNDWKKTSAKNYSFMLFTNQDGDMIAFLDSQPNKAGYLKELIKKDMLNHNN